MPQVAAAAFNRPLTPAFSEDVLYHLQSGLVQVFVKNGQPLAFTVIQPHPDINVIYLAALAKSPGGPSGIVQTMVGHFLNRTPVSAIAVRTQNDRVYEMLCRFCFQVVPLDRPPRIPDLEILHHLGLINSNVDPATLIAIGHYGSPLIQNLPRRRSQDQRITLYSDQLNYQSGDAAVLLGYRQKK